MNTLNNQSDVIDSRDIINRIEELQNSYEFWQVDNPELTIEDYKLHYPEESKELQVLEALQGQCACCDDWQYGEQLIRRSCFKPYMDDMIEDCYDIPKDMPDFMSIVLDYGMLEQDYMSVDFDGQEYLIRSV